MHTQFPTQSSKSNYQTFHRCLSLLITILLLGGTITAQDSAAQDRKTQEEEAVRLMAEGLQLVAEGSPTSLTKALEKIESARILCHSLNVPEGEAVMLSLAGSAYQRLEQN